MILPRRVVKVIIFHSHGLGSIFTNGLVLDFATNHVADQGTVASDKAQVEVGTFVLPMSKPRKAINVQLALKGSVLRLIKESAKEKRIKRAKIRKFQTGTHKSFQFLTYRGMTNSTNFLGW